MDEELLLVKSRVQEMIRNQGCYPSPEALRELNDMVEEAVQKATERTKANGRKRVKSVDI